VVAQAEAPLMRRLGTALGLALVAAAFAAPAAGASSVTIDPHKTLRYTAGANEANHLRIWFDTTHYVYVFEDTGVASISVTGDGCFVYSPQIVYCPYGKFSRIDAQLGDGGSYAADDLSLTTVTIHGGSRADTLIGGGGSVTLDGGGGADTLTAGSGTTKLIAGPGGATMNGGTGRSTYQGSPDPDTINARNGVAELVTCGGAVDAVNADESDTVAGDCENVTRGQPVVSPDPPPADPLAGAITAPAPAPVAVSQTPVAVDRQGRVPVGLWCPANTPGGCEGVVTLSYPAGAAKAGHVMAARRERRVVGRSRRFRIAAGHKAAVPVKLSRRGVRIFKRRKHGHKRRTRLAVTVSLRTEAGVRTVRSTITVKARRRPPTARRTRR
jgi:hypothetical protein